MHTEHSIWVGLGDLFLHLFCLDWYNHLSAASEDNRFTISWCSHNPYLPEVFAWHPQREFIRDLRVGKDYARQHHFIPNPPRPDLMRAVSPPVFYPSPDDLVALTELGDCRQSLVVAATAGTVDRNLPRRIIDDVVAQSADYGLRLIWVGRNYARGGRGKEIPAPAAPHVVSMVDRLSVPGTLILLSQCLGLVTCHSSLTLAGWLLDKPQQQYIPGPLWNRVGRRRKWLQRYAFGRTRPDCDLCQFEHHDAGTFPRFVRRVQLTRPE